ncbi:hypothetical protein EBZ38_17190 [bacterium]|nr:hypothetical protein [bacterium]NDD85996.1 hypothetical protein [bacterium]
MFNDWFGATIAVDLPGCVEATNTTRSCVWMLRNPNGQSYFTAQVNARDALVAGSGYSYVWSPFFGNAVSLPGNIPIYRLTKPNGGSLITASKPEYDYLAANGFDGQGIDFYADPANSNSGYTVYRLYKPSTDEHIWVKGESDRSVAINNWGFTDEGVAFNSISPIRQEQAAPTNQLLVYRFADMPGNSHFWTTDLAERDRMINQGYNYERVAWNSSALTTTKKVYRLYSSKMQKHLYTLDENEKNILSASGFWVYEGISQYMSDAPTARPVYRLYSPVTTNHLWTTDANERDVLVRSGTFRDEGIAWYQP